MSPQSPQQVAFDPSQAYQPAASGKPSFDPNGTYQAAKLSDAWGTSSDELQDFLSKNPGYKYVPADPKFPNRPEGVYPTGPGNEWRNDPSYTQTPVDLHLGKHTYEGAKEGLMAATAPMALEASVPQLLGGAAGATVGGVAGQQIAKTAGAGETGQEVAGDVGGLIGGGVGAKISDIAVNSAKSLYGALPKELQQELIGALSPRLLHALKLGKAASAMVSDSTPGVNPALVSPSRTIPGQVSPEVINPEPTGPIPGVDVRPSLHRIMPDRGLALPAAPEYPGAPLPEAPSPEVSQAKGLAEGSKVVSHPAKALMELPVHAVNQAVQELGLSAPLPSLTARANQIANLAVEGAGGKLPEPLQPNVPLRNQGGIVTPKPAAGIPEGHTPVDSSALKSYKYDPETQEFDAVTQNGQRYIHGEVSPDEAAKFEAADSKGKAWNELRKNSTLVAKVVNGKRIPVKPVISPEDSISDEEWQHGHELETQVESSKR